jgi:hypothetical protein
MGSRPGNCCAPSDCTPVGRVDSEGVDGDVDDVLGGGVAVGVEQAQELLGTGVDVAAPLLHQPVRVQEQGRPRLELDALVAARPPAQRGKPEQHVVAVEQHRRLVGTDQNRRRMAGVGPGHRPPSVPSAVQVGEQRGAGGVQREAGVGVLERDEGARCRLAGVVPGGLAQHGPDRGLIPRSHVHPGGPQQAGEHGLPQAVGDAVALLQPSSPVERLCREPGDGGDGQQVRRVELAGRVAAESHRTQGAVGVEQRGDDDVVAFPIRLL